MRTLKVVKLSQKKIKRVRHQSLNLSKRKTPGNVGTDSFDYLISDASKAFWVFVLNQNFRILGMLYLGDV